MLLTVVLAISLGSAYSQVDDKTITVEKRKYYQSGQRLDLKQVKTILAANPASAPEYELYKKKNSIGTPCMLVGLGCVAAGAGVGMASSFKETDDLNNGQMPGDYPSGLGLMALGLVVEIVGVVFVIPANKHFKQAISDYNSGNSKSGLNNVQVKLYAYNKGLGIRITF